MASSVKFGVRACGSTIQCRMAGLPDLSARSKAGAKSSVRTIRSALRPNGIRWYAVCMELAVAYYRVSTRQQHRSGLGIEAQRATVTRFAETENLRIIAEYVEAEIGKGADALDRRPNSQLRSQRPATPRAVSWSRSSTASP